MTEPITDDARQVGLARALQEFEAILAKRDDDQPHDINEVAGLPIYEKP